MIRSGFLLKILLRPDQISINLLCNEANQVIREEKSEDLEEFDF